MKAVIGTFTFLIIFLSGCATRTRSLVLGGAGGVALGGYTGSAIYSGQDRQSQNRGAFKGIAIGLGVGLLTSYLLHDHVEERLRSQQYDQDERLRFGDLPPNPFNPANQRFNEPTPRRK